MSPRLDTAANVYAKKCFAQIYSCLSCKNNVLALVKEYHDDVDGILNIANPNTFTNNVDLW